MKKFRIVVVLALGATALLACQPVKPVPGGAPAGETPPTSAPLPLTDTYVALGDSFVAGPLIPVQDTGPTAGCLRSSNNYPSLVAPSTGLPNFVDVSCSGAETDDMTQEQGVSPGPNPPQFDALSVTTGIVTLGIGGNDIGFSEIAQNCAGPPTGTPCQDTYRPGGPGTHDELHERIVATGPKVDAVLDGIRERAPQARIFVVNYLPIIPDPADYLPTCYPQLPIPPGDIPYLYGVQQELNAMLAAQAAANGAVLVDAYTAGIGKDACQVAPVLRWVEPVVFVPLAAPVHPNIFGMQGVADAVVAAL